MTTLIAMLGYHHGGPRAEPISAGVMAAALLGFRHRTRNADLDEVDASVLVADFEEDLERAIKLERGIREAFE